MDIWTSLKVGKPIKLADKEGTVSVYRIDNKLNFI